MRLWRDQAGASLIDYAILAALITVLVVIGVAVAGTWLLGTWAHVLANRYPFCLHGPLLPDRAQIAAGACAGRGNR
jgi:Flp pilus assembly pilin Flp